MPVKARTFEYAVEVDRAGRITIPGGAQVSFGEGWTADHMLLAALVRCSIDSFAFHARRGGHELAASGDAHGTITRPSADERYQFVEIGVRIEAQLTPRAADPSTLIENAERDCFIGASLKVKPGYEWHVS